jgi:catechol 2,3-dioxygenase-like lactoylglutathione lyase family enzyme
MQGLPPLPAVAPQCTGVQHVALRSADLARSRGFYVETLGLPLLMDSHDQFVVLAGQTSVGVHAPAAGTPDAVMLEPPRVGLEYLSLCCETDGELARIAEALAARGIDSTGVCTDAVLERRFVAFRDPDGIRWEVYVT